MSNRNKAEEYRSRIAELERRIGLHSRLRRDILVKVSEINSNYRRGRISHEEKTIFFDRLFDKQPYIDWIQYYDSDIKKSREIISGLIAHLINLGTFI